MQMIDDLHNQTRILPTNILRYLDHRTVETNFSTSSLRLANNNSYKDGDTSNSYFLNKFTLHCGSGHVGTVCGGREIASFYVFI